MILKYIKYKIPILYIYVNKKKGKTFSLHFLYTNFMLFMEI